MLLNTLIVTRDGNVLALANNEGPPSIRVAAYESYRAGVFMMGNSHAFDKTPWTGWPDPDTTSSHAFELLLHCVALTNFVLADEKMKMQHSTRVSLDEVRTMYSWPPVPVLFTLDDLNELAEDLLRLGFGLHCVFTVHSSSADGPGRLETIRNGLSIIERALNHHEQPSWKPILDLCHQAREMCTILRGMDTAEPTKAPKDIVDIVDGFRLLSVTLVKPVRWVVQKCKIPARLLARMLERGLLEPMKTVPKARRDEYLLENAFEHVEDGGPHYIL